MNDILLVSEYLKLVLFNRHSCIFLEETNFSLHFSERNYRIHQMEIEKVSMNIVTVALNFKYN